jgi:hypothetical protein
MKKEEQIRCCLRIRIMCQIVRLRLPPIFSWVRVTRSLVLYVMFCRSLFVLFLFAIVLSVLRF